LTNRNTSNIPPCATSFEATGDVLPQFEKTDSINDDPAIASFFGTFSIGAETPDRSLKSAEKFGKSHIFGTKKVFLVMPAFFQCRNESRCSVPGVDEIQAAAW
jgi:hypothetical protein